MNDKTWSDREPPTDIIDVEGIPVSIVCGFCGEILTIEDELDNGDDPLTFTVRHRCKGVQS